MISGVPLFFKGNEKTGLSSLVKGQVVDATVVKVLSSTRAELMVAGRVLTVETSLALSTGQTLRLQATGADGFEIVKPPADIAQKPSILPGPLFTALGSLTDPNPLEGLARFVSLHARSSPAGFSSTGPSQQGSGLDRLEQLFSSICLNSDSSDPGFVPRILEKMGPLLEKSMSMLTRADPGQGEMLKPLGEFVDAMEKFQILNNSSSDTARYLIPFPILNDNLFTFGQIFLDLGKKNDNARPEAQRLVRASLFLTMTNLGPLRVDLSVLNREIATVFQAADDNVVAFVRTMVPLLRQRLTTQGFTVLQVKCQRAAPEKISRASIADQFVKQDASNLDLMV